MKPGFLLVVAAASGLWACDTGSAPAPDTAADTLSENKADNLFGVPEDDVKLPAMGQIVTLVQQPKVLMALEEAGYTLDALLASQESGDGVYAPRRTNAALIGSSRWFESISDHVAETLDAIGQTDTFTYGAEPFVKRLFNKNWLRSSFAQFELTAVVHRLDRRDFYPHGRNCGEVRFLYRLSYHKPGNDNLYSRMPMVLNLVYEVPLSAWQVDDTCRAVAARQRVSTPLEATEDYVAWLAANLPIDDADRLRFKQVELNFQAVRIPSESKDDLGGHAEYVMRIFVPDHEATGRLIPAPLENTPDVSRVRFDPTLKGALKAYIRDNLNAIDRGVYQLPAEFLAREATSVSTHGLHRRANRPFAQVFEPAELADLDFSNTSLVKSPEALLLRLDDGTCTGCHQSNSVAGFHILGMDRMRSTHPLNAVRLPGSAHLMAELDRRHAYVETILRGQAPEARRPFSFQAYDGSPLPAGGRCITTGDQADHFKQAIGCESDLYCKTIVRGTTGLDVGTCVRPDNVPVAGDPCFEGALVDHEDPREDTLGRTRFGCGGYACLQPEEGTPLGLCYANCGPGDTAHNEHEICAYNGGATFDSCATTGDWAGCIIESTRRGLRTACDETTPCRDDYICQRLFEFEDGTVKIPEDTRGYCVPNYFLFQLRLDGHPHDPLAP